MFLRLGFSHMMAHKLVEDQEIDSPSTQASLSDEDISVICEVIISPCSLVSRRHLTGGIRFLY